MKIRITSAMLIDGKHTPVGTIVDVDEETGQRLTGSGNSAVRIEEDPEENEKQ